MGKYDVAFDAETFTRTASLFVAKHDSFAPDAIRALAGDIVGRLAEAAMRGPQADDLVISDDDLDEFFAAVVEPGPEASIRFIEGQRNRGLTRKDVYLGYVAAASRWLGEQWDDDRLSTLEVTCATGHLYALMRAMRAEAPVSLEAFDERRCALFATVPGEDHGMGITIAANVFREAGWDIDLQVGAGHEALITHVERTVPHVIGLSLSTEERLDALIRLVVALRLTVPDALIGVAPAARMDGDRVQRLVDIDLVFDDAQTAFAELDRLVRMRG